jgi:hypothetical protein
VVALAEASETVFAIERLIEDAVALVVAIALAVCRRTVVLVADAAAMVSRNAF